MPQTPLGLTYPEPGDHTRLWEHFQTLAEDVDALEMRDRIFMDRSTPVSVPNSTSTDVGGGFGYRTGDQHGTTFDYSAGVITCQRPMLALHNVYVSWNPNSNGARRIDYNAGGQIVRSTVKGLSDGGNQGMTLSTVTYLSAGASSQMTLYQNCGATLDTFFIMWSIVPLILLG